jgi:hypothetical protein
MTQNTAKWGGPIEWLLWSGAEVLKVTIITSYLKLMEYVLYTYALFQSRSKKKQNVKESEEYSE